MLATRFHTHGSLPHLPPCPLPPTPAGEPLLTEETIEHVTQIVAQHGSDAWWQMEVADLLPEHLRGGERQQPPWDGLGWRG